MHEAAIRQQATVVRSVIGATSVIEPVFRADAVLNAVREPFWQGRSQRVN